MRLNCHGHFLTTVILIFLKRKSPKIYVQIYRKIKLSRCFLYYIKLHNYKKNISKVKGCDG